MTANFILQAMQFWQLKKNNVKYKAQLFMFMVTIFKSLIATK